MRNIVLSLLSYKLISVTSGTMTFDTEIVDANNLIIDYFIEKNHLAPFKNHVSYDIDRYGEGRVLRRYVAQDREHPYGSGCYSSYDELEFKLDSLDYEDIINGKGIIEPIFEDDKVILKKYIIDIEHNNIVPNDTLIIKIENDDFSFYLNGKKIDIKDTESFFKHSVMLSGYEKCLKTLIYNNHVKKPACKDIYLDYLLFFKQTNSSLGRGNSYYLITLYYSYMASEKFLLLFEFNIKNNIGVNGLGFQNPVYTNKPYEDVTSMKSISKTSLDIIKIKAI